MKILELRFKNINSLYGEWCIDFTDPNFVADGLFAITGPTGSGKTTILDALCLALYGQTPRLGKMTASDNEVMSRQTGECSTEVVFETVSGTYRAAWQQHRSRKKASGALQSPKREIAKADGEILAEKLKDVQDQIDSITGMSFDRFTRSILLAQGSFDTFLKANADERSPILEQITGTEIYTEISKMVHERNSAENQKRTTLEAGLGGIQLLSAEELEQIEFDQKQLEAKHKDAAAKRDAMQAALDGHGRIRTLETELDLNRQAQNDWTAAHAIFAPDAQRLETAKKTQSMRIDHITLVNLRHALEQINAEIKSAEATLPQCQADHETAVKNRETTEKELAAKTAEQEQLIPILKQVREFDIKMAERATMLNKAQTELAQQKIDLADLLAQETQNRTALKEQMEQGMMATLYQCENAIDAQLVGELSVLLQQIEQLKQQQQNLDAAIATAQASKAHAQIAEQTATQTSEQFTQAQQHFVQTETELHRIVSELEKNLNGQRIDEWQNRLLGLNRRFELETKTSNNQAALKTNQQNVASATIELNTTHEKQDALRREQKLLLQNLQLQQKIESLETERGALADGQPCPLCGALDHPYAEHLPHPETGSIDKINKALEDLSVMINQLTEAKSAAETQCKTLEMALANDAKELNQLPTGDAEECSVISARIEQVQQLEKQQVDAQNALERARTQQTKLQQAHQAAEQTVAVETEKYKAAQKQQLETEATLNAAGTALRLQLEPFGVSIENAAEQLPLRQSRWTESEQKHHELKQAMAQTEALLSQQAKQIETAQKQSNALELETATQTAELDALKSSRMDLFYDRQPDAVENELRTAVQQVRSRFESAQTMTINAEQALKLAEQRLETLRKSCLQQEPQQKQGEVAFMNKLREAGFENETDWLAVQLSDAEQAQLETRSEELKAQQTALIAVAAEKTQQLQKEREQKHVAASPEEHAECGEICTELLEQIGGLKKQRESNEKAQTIHAEKLTEIEQQKTECNRWNMLHELIGSADGKKFRNFAQGLTFELMVSQANRQLAKMSDRYLLMRDIEKPLDLNVVDNYQAGEIRPVKNLSGGESFVVSLSLALGLSKMASKTIRVDSLFLDEGFGTLDEEALETALEALTELKEDGKLIGVISHVGALKERIGTQINVHTSSGGRSKLTGTGVSEGA